MHTYIHMHTYICVYTYIIHTYKKIHAYIPRVHLGSTSAALQNSGPNISATDTPPWLDDSSTCLAAVPNMRARENMWPRFKLIASSEQTKQSKTILYLTYRPLHSLNRMIPPHAWLQFQACVQWTSWPSQRRPGDVNCRANSF